MSVVYSGHGLSEVNGILELGNIPKDVGDRSTPAITYSLHAAGYDLLVPFGENTRHDLGIDDGTWLARVQRKTGRLHDGAIIFRTASSYRHHPNPKRMKRDYVGEIDFFGVFCPDNGGVYLIPIAETPTGAMASLRVSPPRNGQRRRIRYASTFEVTRLSAIHPKHAEANPQGAQLRLSGERAAV